MRLAPDASLVLFPHLRPTTYHMPSKFKALSFEFCLPATVRGPVECCAFWRAAASNLGVRWGDLRNDTVPPGAGHGVNEERTSSGVGLFTLVGYYSGGALSRDIVSIRQLTDLAQGLFN